MCDKTESQAVPIIQDEEFVKPEEIEFKPMPEDGKKFRFAGMRVMLTYKTHLNKIDLCRFLTEKIAARNRKIVFMRVAHENGNNDKDMPYKHSHVIIELESKLDVTNATSFFDFEGIHPHIQPCINAKGFENMKIYIAKEDPENRDLKKLVVGRPERKKRDPADAPNLFDIVQSCSSSKEAINKYATKFSDVSGIMAIRSQNEMKFTPIPFEPDTTWKQEIVRIYNRPVDHRHINWFFEPVGNSGKTKFALSMIDNFGKDKVYVCSDLGTSRDASTIITNALSGGWYNPKMMIIDLPRTVENNKSIYQIMETIKNGLVTATKYAGGTVRFNPPHIVVFANWEPQIGGMSKDRWRIRKINADTSFTCIKAKSGLNEKRLRCEVLAAELDKLRKELFVEENKNNVACPNGYDPGNCAFITEEEEEEQDYESVDAEEDHKQWIKDAINKGIDIELGEPEEEEITISPVEQIFDCPVVPIMSSYMTRPIELA